MSLKYNSTGSKLDDVIHSKDFQNKISEIYSDFHVKDEEKKQFSTYSSKNIKPKSESIKVHKKTELEISPDYIIQIIKNKLAESGDTIAKLDNEWTAVNSGLQRMSFLQRSTNQKYWCPPVNLWECIYNMPYSVEIGLDNRGMVYFIDHSKNTVSNIHPLESLPPPLQDQFTFETKSTCIKLPQPITNNKIGMVCVQNQKNTVVVSVIDKGSIFGNYLMVGDNILMVDSFKIEKPDDLYPAIRNKSQVVINFVRGVLRSKLMNTSIMGPKKSSIKSANRTSFLKSHPVSVHFSDRPIILSYQHETQLNSWEARTIERNFSDVLKVFLATGTTKSLRFTKTQTVYDFVSEILRKISIPMPHCFTLALVPTNNTDIIYFSPEQPVHVLASTKKDRPELDCYLLLFSIPSNIEEWTHPDYIPLVNYLYYQSYSMILTAKMPWLSKISSENLQQLIALASTIGFLISGLDQLDSHILAKETPALIKQLSAQNSGSIDPLLKADTILASPNKVNNSIRLSTYKLEQWSFIPKNAAIKELRQDLDNYVIVSLMINAFKELTSNDLKIYYLGEPSCYANFNISYDKKFRDKIFSVIHKAQLALIQACLDLKIVSYIKYRIHVCISPILQTTKSLRSIGMPTTIVLSPDLIEIEDQDAILEVIKFSEVTGIVASYKDLDHFIITIFSTTTSKVLSVIANIEIFRSILWILSAFANNIYLQIPKRTVPVIDVTNNEYRCDSTLLPKYSDVHLVIPSLWNYASAPGFFFKIYNETANNIINSNYQEAVRMFSPYLMIYSPKAENIACGYNLSTIKTSFHLNPLFLSDRNLVLDKITHNTKSDNSTFVSSSQSDEGLDLTAGSFAVRSQLLADEVDYIKNSNVPRRERKEPVSGNSLPIQSVDTKTKKLHINKKKMSN